MYLIVDKIRIKWLGERSTIRMQLAKESTGQYQSGDYLSLD